MEQPSDIEATPASGSDPPTIPAASKIASHHQRDRRREKPQLSCTYCRRRKVRCDRQLPCQSCVSKGIALSCTYAPAPQRKGTTSVGERIQQLEALVRSLVQQQQTPHTPAGDPGGPSADPLTPSFGSTPGDSTPQIGAVGVRGSLSLESIDEDTVPITATPAAASASVPEYRDRAISPTPSEPGSTRVHWHGENYVSSVHWAAVLDSISELKDHYEKEEEARMLMGTSDYVPRYTPGPRLLYEPVQANKSDILASMPARPVVDRMVARYFNAQGVAPAILHSGQFLQEYETFWQNPTAASFNWIALLFSIMCLSTQYQLLAEDPTDTQILTRLYVFRERTANCLVLGQFTLGGPHVLETLILSCATEALLCKDADIGPWLLFGILVQLALSLGYHREPSNISNISVFAGEMRRRVWAAIVQIDLRLSSQMGLPRLLSSHQCDTIEPRNLLDSDFDETTDELPPSRPETEVTPALYGLAKNRIDRISGPISDIVSDTREHPYSEIMDLDRRLQEAERSLPPIFQWQPLTQSFMMPPQIIMHRIWLRLAVQRLVIWLHRKYLAPPSSPSPSHHDDPADRRCGHSRRACVEAAIQILEIQKLVDEETQADGQLHSVRWMLSSLAQSSYLLGMSVLCYYLQLTKTADPALLEDDDGRFDAVPLRARIHDLLRTTYPMWLRSSTVSRDARRAVEHLSVLLGLRSEDRTPPSQVDMDSSATPPLAAPQDAAMSVDQVSWDAYQECIANFPEAFNSDFMALDVAGPPSVAPGPSSAADSLFTNATRLDEWLAMRDTQPG